ncbi:MAG TPA: DUF2905 domain-containing protein [Bryobacteraceae bacterium]|nr:DUF2905 domain-containing protein [Bryobacteraceae bacterium]
MAFGRMLVIMGLVLVAAGVLFMVGDKLPIRFGRLPGDIVLRGRHSTFYFPLASSIVISIVLSILFWLFRR